MTRKKAEQLVSKLEELPLGEQWADAAAEARDAIDELRQKAAAQLFPPAIRPTSGDVYAALQWHSRRFPAGPGFGDQMAALHARCLDSHPDLAALIRSPDVRADVGQAAAAWAPRLARQPAEMAAEAGAAFELALARQLAARDHELAGPARDLVAAAELDERLEAETERRKAHAAEELGRREREREEAEAVREAERRRRIEQAKEEIRQAQRQELQAKRRARQLRAEALAERLEASGLRDLRMGGGPYDVATLVHDAPRMSERQLDEIEAALDQVAR